MCVCDVHVCGLVHDTVCVSVYVSLCQCECVSACLHAKDR